MKRRNGLIKKAIAFFSATTISMSLFVPKVMGEEIQGQDAAAEETINECGDEIKITNEIGSESEDETIVTYETLDTVDIVAYDSDESQIVIDSVGEEKSDTKTDSESAEVSESAAEDIENIAETEDGGEVPQADDINISVQSIGTGTQADEQMSTFSNALESYDTTKPVLEKVVLPQNGQTLSESDSFIFYIYAYDDDSGIYSADANIMFSGESGTSTIPKRAEYDSNLGCYVGKVSLDNVFSESIGISSVEITDNAGNVLVEYQQNADGSELWKNNISFVRKNELKYTVKDFVLEEQGKTLKEGDQIHMSFVVEPAIVEGLGMLNVIFDSSISATYNYYPVYNTETGRYECSAAVSGESLGRPVNITQILQSIGIETLGDRIEFEIANPGDYWFKIAANEVDDTEKPKILSIEMEKKGQVVQAGDIVTIQIKATDNIGLSDNAYIRMQTDQLDIAQNTQTINLDYDGSNDIYTGEFVIDEETYPCEWYIGYVHIEDLSGNEAYVTDYDPDFYRDDPYYVNVVNKGTFVGYTFDAGFSFMAINENGELEEVAVIEKNVTKRSTFKEEGIEFPELEYVFDGLTHTGWYDLSGNLYDENTQINTENTYTVLYAGYDKSLVKLKFNYIDSSGEYNNQERFLTVPNGTAYVDLSKYVSTLPEPENMTKEFIFEEWKLPEREDGFEIPSKYVLSVSLYANYTKNPIKIYYDYLNKDGEWVTEKRYHFYEDGTTYGELFEAAAGYIPEDAYDELEITGFVIKPYYSYTYPSDQVIPAEAGYKINPYYTADYGDKAVVISDFAYNKADGTYGADRIPIIVNKGTSYADIYELYLPAEPDSYEGLVFTGWTKYSEDQTVDSSGANIYATAQYSNYVVRFIIDERFREGSGYYDSYDFVTCIVAEEGETVVLPAAVEGYEKVTWLDDLTAWPDDGKLTVTEDVTFYGYGEKIEDVVEPSTPTPTPTPGQTEGSGTTQQPDTPVVTPGQEADDTVMKDAVEKIQKASSGETIEVDMGSVTIISKEILNAAKGKNVNIQLIMDGYTWTINGTDIMDSELMDINLKVTLYTDGIPNSTIKAIAGEKPVVQLNLEHEGDFGFRAMLTINVGDEYAGKAGNLYYHTSDGKMVFIDSGIVAANGDISLMFSHASDYAIVFEGEAEISDDSKPGAGSNTETGVTKNEVSSTTSGGVATGDASLIEICVFMAVSAISIVAALAVAKKRSVK